MSVLLSAYINVHLRGSRGREQCKGRKRNMRKPLHWGKVRNPKSLITGEWTWTKTSTLRNKKTSQKWPSLFFFPLFFPPAVDLSFQLSHCSTFSGTHRPLHKDTAILVEDLQPALYTEQWVGGSVSQVLNHFNCVQLSATLKTVAHQAPLSMKILQARILEWLPCPSPGDLPDPGIKPLSFMSPALAGGFFPPSATWEVHEESFCRFQLKNK